MGIKGAAAASMTGSLSADEASNTKSTTSSASSADLHTVDYLQVMDGGVPTVFVKRSAVEAHAEAWLPTLVASLNKQHGHVNVTTQVTDAQFREIVETASPAEAEEEDGKASMVLSDGQSDLCPLMLNDNGPMFRAMLRPGRVPPVECLAIACLSGASSCVRILLDRGVPTDKDVPAKWGAGHAGDSPLNSALRAITGKARFTTPRGLSFRPLEALQAGDGRPSPCTDPTLTLSIANSHQCAPRCRTSIAFVPILFILPYNPTTLALTQVRANVP